MLRLFLAAFVLAQATVMPDCSGGSGSSGSNAVQNTVPLIVGPGPTGDAVNEPFVSVTVCVPGQASNCQTIDNVLVDTGSSGLRVLSSVMTVSLPPQTNANGAVMECLQFEDGYTWGPVATADITVGAETAVNVPMQVIGTPGAPPVPAACANSGMPPENTPETLGANGVLGVGLFRQDCGLGCTFTGSSNPAFYYACPNTSGCQVVAQSLAQQVQNPAWLFPHDNNGVVIQLPAVTGNGLPMSAGTLVFGIGTQSNNAIGSAAVLPVDGNGNFTTTLNGTTAVGFIDSGSNGYYFLNSAQTGLPLCRDTSDFYCPPNFVTFSATNMGINGRTVSSSFTVGNAEQLLNLPLSVVGALGGPNPGFFDWGSPFFYGRTVFTAIEGQSTSAGTGPYFAY